MVQKDEVSYVSLNVDRPIWDEFFTVYPLVLVGTKEADGSYDLAPKHLAIPVSWENYFGFVCSETHGTYQNIKREGEFTVSYPRPTQAVLASLAASPREDDASKPIVGALPTNQAKQVDGLFLADSYLNLECKLHQVIDGLGKNSLITGQIIAASIMAQAVRREEVDDVDIIRNLSLMAYLYPGRIAEITKTQKLPFPVNFRR